MTNKLSLVLLVFLVSAPVQSAEFFSDKPALIRESIFGALMFADYKQTETIAQRPSQYHEQNPVLGLHPSTGAVTRYFAGAMILHVGIAAILPGKYRRVFQDAGIAIEAGAVVNNISLKIPY